MDSSHFSDRNIHVQNAHFPCTHNPVVYVMCVYGAVPKPNSAIQRGNNTLGSFDQAVIMAVIIIVCVH